MKDKVNVAIVGTGFGQQVQAPAFRALPQCDLRAIGAVPRAEAEKAAAALGVGWATDDWRELVSSSEIDALALAVPPSLQPVIARAAIEAGKHVFCEKPLALDAVQAEDLLAAANHARVVHAMDFLFPEIAAWQKAKELLDGQALGRIRHAALTWRVETYTYRTQAQNWKTTATLGGGTLNNFASHTFYYLEWLLGPMVRLAASLSPRQSEVEARVDAWAEFEGGFTGTLSVAADAFLGCGHRLEVYGDAGTLLLENTTPDHGRGFVLSLGTRTSRSFTRIEIPGGDSHPDGRILPASRIAGRFLEAILHGGGVAPNLVHGLRVQRLLDTVRLAHRTGSWQGVAAP